MNSNFNATMALGAKSETVVANYLTSKGWQVTDRTKEKEYQDKDIDFTAIKADDFRSIEVKMDNRVGTTGNLLLETITNLKNGNLGWFNKTKAQYIFIHNTGDNQLIIAATDDLRAYLKLEGNLSRYREWELFEGYGYKTACGYTIPLNHFTTIYTVGIVDLGEEE